MAASPFSRAVDVPVEGGTLAVARAGARPGGGAPVVVAAHGITSNLTAWAVCARLLGDEVCLLAPDLRGRGRSAGVAGPFGMARHAADLAAVLDHFSVAEAVAAGHSMGASVAALLAGAEPHRIRALVLVDGGLPFGVPPGTDAQAALDAVLGPAIARLRQTFPTQQAYHEFWRRHPAFAGSDIDDADLVSYADHDLSGSEPELRSSVREDAVRADGADLLQNRHARLAVERVQCPTIALRAPRGLLNDDNPLIPAEHARAFVAAHPHVRVREVADTNHYSITVGARGAEAVAAAIRELARAG